MAAIHRQIWPWRSIAPTGPPAPLTPTAVGRKDAPSKTSAPHISTPLLRWFTWYARAYVRRHFHALRVAGTEHLDPVQFGALVVFANHPSWWDPMIGLILKEIYFPSRRLFVPMEGKALARYGFFRKLGFFGVEGGRVTGGRSFLRTASGLLQNTNSMLALTPQGRFADVRERPVQFREGIGHLAVQAQDAVFLPVAIEYVFWEERRPEVLVQFGKPLVPRACDSPPDSAAGWTVFLSRRLAETQELLADAAQRREHSSFAVIWRGQAGPGGIYDVWRTLRARLRGEAFQKAHGVK